MMTNDDSTTPTPTTTTSTVPKAALSFQKVKDSRGRKLRGLWIRGTRYYAQMTVVTSDGRKQVKRIPLQGATNFTEALKLQKALEVKRDEGTLQDTNRRNGSITFAQLVTEYLSHIKLTKAKSTFACAKSNLLSIAKEYGAMDVRIFSAKELQNIIKTRLEQGLSHGTINRTRIILGNALTFAKSQRYISRTPDFSDVAWLKYRPKRKPLLTQSQIDSFCDTALKSGRPQRFVDFVKLLSLTGGRKTETLFLRWSDINWATGSLPQLTFVKTKNGLTRTIDCYPALDAHLRDMHARRLPDSIYLFPSPIDTNNPRLDFKRDLKAIAKLTPDIPLSFHTLRHFFCSRCVMLGIDFMTIASWVGHQDGGVLIGRVYGHLSNQHRQAMAQRLG